MVLMRTECSAFLSLMFLCNYALGLEHEQLGAVDYVVSRTVTPDSTSHVLVDEESEKDVAIDVLASTSASASAPAGCAAFGSSYLFFYC